MEQFSTLTRQAVQAGLEHHQAGRLPEAESYYQRVLQADPNNPDALHLLGVIAFQVGKYEIAVQLYDKALLGKPDYVEALLSRGNVLYQLRFYTEALSSYDRALEIKPDYAEALLNRGNVLLTIKRHVEALSSFDRALEINPDYAEALSNRGNVLHELNRYDEALDSYDRALSIKPDYAQALSNRGNALQELERHEEALASHDRALAINPSYAQASYNRGNVLQELGRYPDALASYDRALATNGDHAESWSNRGLALGALKRYSQALASYERALRIWPDYPGAHWNASLCRLIMGDFVGGWAEYEWRWKWESFPSAKRHFRQPLWLGHESIAGKTILLHAEQGLGDTIQFVRYVRKVSEEAARIVLEVPATLNALFSTSLKGCQVVSAGNWLPHFDLHCPLLSLPLAFRTNQDSIPVTVPYLHADGERVAAWEARLGKRAGPRIGIVWSGSALHKNDRNRSFSLRKLSALQDLGVTLVGLQNEMRDEDKSVLAANKNILHFGSELKDFSDTAALVSLMDLIISVDTSVAHLAGALGKPVWILLPFASDWRWMVDREDSPWYPTARLFRQSSAGDWGSVLGRVREAVEIMNVESDDVATPGLLAKSRDAI